MTRTSKRQVPPPTGGTRAPSYSRFIPREELGAFAAWSPETLSNGSSTPQPQTKDTQTTNAANAEEEDAKQLFAARQSGYQDGYRDGLVALESFKRSYATQITAQLGSITEAYMGQLDKLQEQLAQVLATTATQLAGQVVRSEIAARPDLIAGVAQEAIETLLMSARHITLRIHPEDHALVAQGIGETLASRGVRLVTDTTLTRGGCIVESDIGVIDATMQTRWERAAAALGCESTWTDGPSAATVVESEPDV